MADTNEYKFIDDEEAPKRTPLTIEIVGNKNTPVEQQNTSVEQQNTPHSDDHPTFEWAPQYDEDETKENTFPASKYLTGAGAGLGAYGSYKGVGLDFVKPHPEIFAPKKINTGVPSNIHSVSPEEYARSMANTADGMSDVEHMMQSGQGRRAGTTGRQQESSHNWETNRQALATKEGLQAPGASKAIVDFGPMAPRQSGIGISKNLAANLEEEQMMAEARAKVLRDTAEKAAKEKLAKETAEKLAAEQKAAKWAGIRSGAAKIGLGGLGGAFAANDIYEAIDEMRARGIDDENIAKLIGGVGGGLMVIPTPLTQAGGAALVGGSMAWPYVREHLGYKQKH